MSSSRKWKNGVSSPGRSFLFLGQPLSIVCLSSLHNPSSSVHCWSCFSRSSVTATSCA
ncbi:unnamed protein product, partial [Dicrocoelium dendriticum]